MESVYLIAMFIAFVKKKKPHLKAIITVRIVLQITTRIENVWEGNDKLKKTKLILSIQKYDQGKVYQNSKLRCRNRKNVITS